MYKNIILIILLFGLPPVAVATTPLDSLSDNTVVEKSLSTNNYITTAYNKTNKLPKVTRGPKNWQSWLKEVRQEALAQGINPYLFDDVFRGVKPNKRVINFDKRQPEKRLTFLQYRKTRISPYRITLGAKEYKRHRAAVEQIGRQYGVSPCFIIALWGMETSYGRFMGSFPVIKSLATLAYDGRREAFFRKELFLALHILDKGHIDNSRFKGEWAGASGHPQFLPSSWHKFAVDYDGDGRKDIWNNLDDVFASIANYLKGHNWQTGKPWSVQVNVPKNIDRKILTRKITKPAKEWLAMGVTLKPGQKLSDSNIPASVVIPYGGPAFMIFQNFKTLMKYNNSIYYAGSVGYMADKICSRVR